MIWLDDVFEVLRLGLRNLLRNKLRSLLTMLGMIFGVGSVIAMLSVGAGARQEILARIQQLGIKNIIVNSVKPPEDTKTETQNQPKVCPPLAADDLSGGERRNHQDIECSLRSFLGQRSRDHCREDQPRLARERALNRTQICGALLDQRRGPLAAERRFVEPPHGVEQIAAG